MACLCLFTSDCEIDIFIFALDVLRTPNQCSYSSESYSLCVSFNEGVSVSFKGRIWQLAVQGHKEARELLQQL